MSQLKNRQAVIEQYAYELMEGMDMKDMCQFVQDSVEDNLESYTDAEIIEELEDCYPHILEDNLTSE